jgi:hypothetical protein
MESTITKNAGKSTAISIAMPPGNTARCALPNGAHPWLHAKSLNAAIGRVPMLYCPGGRHGQQF